MTRLVLIAALGLVTAACTIDGPPPGRSDPIAEMERQERIRQQTEERQRLCRTTSDEDPRKAERCRGVSGVES